eukprot:scaffold267189_cov37-Tisochrysis_lutea.AAC.1
MAPRRRPSSDRLICPQHAFLWDSSLKADTASNIDLHRLTVHRTENSATANCNHLEATTRALRMMAR